MDIIITVGIIFLVVVGILLYAVYSIIFGDD